MYDFRNNALNKDAEGYDATTNLISLQDLERLMPSGWTLEENFYPYVNTQICAGLATHVAGGKLQRRGFQLFGIDLMCVKTEARFPEIYLLELNLRPKLKIPDEVSIEFQNSVKNIVDHVICCIELHHFNNVVERENRFMEIFLEAPQDVPCTENQPTCRSEVPISCHVLESAIVAAPVDQVTRPNEISHLLALLPCRDATLSCFSFTETSCLTSPFSTFDMSSTCISLSFLSLCISLAYLAVGVLITFGSRCGLLCACYKTRVPMKHLGAISAPVSSAVLE